ncbi:hypothetical protein [Vagococcus sp.]|uniref:hypothetical protein n=1 Tax=Vagococcus sp. TaxID=1933889 RepID=UPI003F9881B1
MKSSKFWMFQVIGLFILAGCGITQELDQSVTATTEISSTLELQEKEMTQLSELTRQLEKDIEKDLKEQENPGFFEEELGRTYKNVEKRSLILDNLSSYQKELKNLGKTLDKIISKKAVDVDNKQLQVIYNSLSIIENNYEALILFLTTGLEQEEIFYQSLDPTSVADVIDEGSNPASIIERNNGSILLLTEEASGNIDYTLNLIEQFQKNAQTKKK